MPDPKYFFGNETASLSDEELWGGWFGIQYTTKFLVDWTERIPFMRKLVEMTKPRSVLDVGTNAGWNLRALRSVDPALPTAGLEINEHVAITAASMGLNIHCGAARYVGENFPAGYEMVMTSGVLIHVPPELLTETMASIVKASSRWVVAVEYPSDEEKVVRFDHVDKTRPRAWSRPYGRMYEALGVKVVADWVPEDGYPDCHCWLMEKK